MEENTKNTEQNKKCVFCWNCVDVSGTGEMGWDNWYCKLHEKDVRPDDTCKDFKNI